MQCLGKVLRRAWCLGGRLRVWSRVLLRRRTGFVRGAADVPLRCSRGTGRRSCCSSGSGQQERVVHIGRRRYGASLPRMRVLSNDKIVAVLREGTPDVDLYSRQTLGLKLCDRLQPVCERNGRPDADVAHHPREYAKFNIPPGGVPLAGQWAAPRHLYALDAGTALHQDNRRRRRGTAAGAGPLPVCGVARLFGDDIVVDASAIPVPRAELQRELCAAHDARRGSDPDDRIGVARSGRGGCHLRRAPRQIVRCDISYGKKPHVWIALSWQGKGSGGNIRSPWRMRARRSIWIGKCRSPPYGTVDWSTADKLAESWEMLLQDPGGKYVMQGWFGQDESAGQRFGKEFGDRDWNKSPAASDENQVLGSFAFRAGSTRRIAGVTSVR